MKRFTRQPQLYASAELQSTVPKLSPPVAFDADNRALLRQVIDYCRQMLLQSPEALDHQKRRGIGSEDAIRQFKLGYANRTLGLRLRTA